MKTKSVQFYMIIATLLIAATLFGCGSSQTAQDEALKIGALLSLTGPAAGFGADAQRGIDLAVEDINTKGGIDGVPIKIIYEDDSTDGAKATTAFEKLVNVDDVDAMIGGTWDFSYNAIAPLAEKYQVTLITPQNVKTSGLIMNDFTFVMRPPMVNVVSTLGEYLEENKIKRVAVLRFISPFGEDITKGLRAILEGSGGEVVADETYASIGGNDFLTTIEKLKSQKPDAIFIDTVGPDTINSLRRVKESGLDVQILSHGDIADTLATPGIDRGLFEGVVFFSYDTPASKGFADQFRAKYGRDPGHSADGAYDAVMLLAGALQQNRSGVAVPKYIESSSIQTINGEVSFVDHVIKGGNVFVFKVAKDGTEILGQMRVG